MIVIEPATMGDAAEILAVQKLAFRIQGSLYGDDTLPPLTETLEEFQAGFANYVILKASVEGQIVGSVRAHMKNEACLIGRLCVHPDFQNQGIGMKLMNAIESACPAPRYKLFTGHRSERNLRLYQNLGYQEYRREEVNPLLIRVFMEKIPDGSVDKP